MKKSYFNLTFLLLLLFSLPGFNAAAQSIQVKGTVTDAATGEPFPYVSILVKGTSTGATTQDDGTYVLSCSPNAVLVYSFVGYKTQEVEVAGRARIDVMLAPDAEMLEDVLVVAYGTAKKSSYSGSAAMVRSEELAQKPVSSVEQAIQGKVAGLQVTTASGQPGASSSFRIRGTGTLNASAEPLYVIDGVATTNASYSQNAANTYTTSSIMSTINPQDIESITVLKDAAAASLYGSRAANGVVIITTKSGKAGSGHMNFNAQLGFGSVPKTYKMMNSAEYYKKAFMSYLESGDDVKSANLKAQGLTSWNPYNVEQPLDASGNVAGGARIIIDTDWQDVVFSPGLTQDYNLSYSGGSDKITYFVSGGYFDQKGTSPTSRYTRYSGKTTVDAKMNKWLKGGGNILFSYATQNSEVSQSAGASPLYNALTFPNAVPVYKVDNNGNYVLDESGEKQYNWSNPVARDFNPIAIPNMNINKANTARLFASFYAEIEFIEGLTAKTVFSPDYVSVYDTGYWNKYHGDGPAYGGRGAKTQTSDLMFTSTTTLNFNRSFGKHGVSAMAGYEYWQSKYNYFDGTATNFAFDFMTELAGAGSIQRLTSFYTEAALMSYLAHAEYNYDEKYFVSGSFRRDGSSVFGADNKWGNFFSVGASWRIAQEQFIQDLGWISDLKLRVSYGTSGNNAGLGRYQALGLWVAANNYLYGNNSGLGHESLSNPELGWEKQKMLNVGLDFGFLNNRLTGSVEFFDKTSDDLLYDFPLPASHGVGEYYSQVSSVMMNLAKVRNRGVEFVLGGTPVQTRDFTWDINFNFSYNADKILDLAGDDDITMSDTKKIWKVGHSQYEFYMPTWAGVDPANGDPLWKKEGGGTTNNYSEAVYEMQGRATPWGFGALTNNLSWKGLNLSFMFYYNLGGKVYDSLYSDIMHDGNDPGKNLHVDALRAWTPSNTQTDVPKYYNTNDNQSNSPSTRFLYDATYLKFKNVNLSYSLPRSWMQKIGAISGARVYVNVDNIFTTFKDKGYKGFDDIDIFGIGGYEQYAYYIPLNRTWTFGVNLTF